LRAKKTIAPRQVTSCVALLLTSVAMTVCGDPRPQPALNLSLAVSPTPPTPGPTRIIVTVTDSLGSPLSDATVSVEGRSDEGRDGPRKIEQAVEERPGRYVLPSFDFDVGGEWLLTVTARTEAGISQTRDFRVSVFGEP